MIMRFEQLSIQTFAYKKISIDRMLESLGKTGITKYEFYAGAPHYCHYKDFPMSREEIDKLTDQIHSDSDENGLKMDCFAPESIEYPLNIASENPSVREKSIRYYLDYMDDLADLGASSMLVTSGWGYFEQDKMPAWNRSRDALIRIAKRAEELGVTLYLRPVSKLMSNLVNNLASLTRMVCEINSSALMACIDTSVLDEAGETISDYFRVIPDKIRYFRFYNLTSAGEVTTGEGLEQIRSYFSDLDRFDYTGTAVMELNFEHLTNPEHYGSLAVKQLKTLF